MKNSLDAFMQKANSISVEDLKNSIKGGVREDCHMPDGSIPDGKGVELNFRFVGENDFEKILKDTDQKEVYSQYKIN